MIESVTECLKNSGHRTTFIYLHVLLGVHHVLDTVRLQENREQDMGSLHVSLS